MKIPYEKEQLTKISRHFANITAHKILAIEGEKIKFKLWYNGEETAELPISMPELFKTGDYVDLRVLMRGSRAAYSMELIGPTPPQFVPAGGADVGLS